mgnify:FL=1
MGVLEKVFGNYSDKELKKNSGLVKKVEALAPTMEAMTDEELAGQTPLFKERLQQGETLDSLLPEAFAVVREASRRVLGMYPFHVQIMGGII